MSNKYISPEEIEAQYKAITSHPEDEGDPFLTAVRMVRWAEAVYRIRMGTAEKIFQEKYAILEKRLDGGWG